MNMEHYDPALYRPILVSEGEVGEFVIQLRKRLDINDKVMQKLVHKIQYLLDIYIPCEDNRFTFPDGDVWKVKPPKPPPQFEVLDE